MGLDMYATTIKATLVDPEWETDFQPNKAARRAVGFIDLTDKEIENLPEEGRISYWNKRKDADKQAQSEGWYNPNFYYWRKFNALHAWMEELYRRKGGTDPDFNCNTVIVTLDDLDRLTKETKQLKATEGFFWGNPYEVYPEDIETIADFVAKSKEAISAGNVVFYDSWW